VKVFQNKRSWQVTVTFIFSTLCNFRVQHLFHETLNLMYNEPVTFGATLFARFMIYLMCVYSTFVPPWPCKYADLLWQYGSLVQVC
jgi:hypothetical protein